VRDELCKKSDSGDYYRSYVIPTKGSLVDFSKSKTTTLVWISNVSLFNCQWNCFYTQVEKATYIIVMEVMKGGISAGRIRCHFDQRQSRKSIVDVEDDAEMSEDRRGIL